MQQPALPPGIMALDPSVGDRVLALVAAAEERQVAEADHAVDHALAIVPRPLRGVVRKVLLG